MPELRSRFYHAPKLHTPRAGIERTAGWLELFYDLIYVAAIIQLGNALSHHADLPGFIAFVGVFIPLWLAWTSFTFFTNRFILDDFLHRALVFLQMFGVGALAICVPDVLDGDPTTFARAYAFVRGVFILFYLRTYLQVPEARDLSKRWLVLSCLDTLMWLISGFSPWPWMYLFWILGIGFQASIPFLKGSREISRKYPPDMLHLAERYGLLTIIVLGESFVKVLTSLYENGLTASTAGMGSLSLLITCSLWWIYFDDVAGSRLKQRRAALYIWVYAHLPMTIGITAVGVSIKKVIFFDPWLAAPMKYATLISATLGLTLVAVAIIDSVTERRQSNLSDRARVQVRLGSALIVFLLGATSQALPAWLFLLLITGICISQILFDLMMAPLEADEHMALMDSQKAFETEHSAASHSDRPFNMRAAATKEPIIRGAPSELKNDVYYFFMDGSWSRLFSSLLFLYLLLNFVFGALYLLEPGSIAGIRQGSMADAFFFSVQTMSTIGYGVMNPTSTYGHVLVTIEAAIGLLGVALVTGLMFAKAARPKASILFSDHPVITMHHGNRTLMFRVGNARGNEVVDASVSVTVLMDEISPEGQHLRRLYDVALNRTRTPVFSMSWTVIHPLDENSPLAKIDFAGGDERFLSMIVTLTGHDSTYAQTIYTRKTYYPEDFRVGYKMVDVHSSHTDGRLIVDYTRFHDIESDVNDD